MDTNELIQILWDYNHLNHELGKADAILALGNHDIRVAEHAAKLFLEGYAPLVIFSGGSGGSGGLTAGWKKPEAEIFADRAEQMGVPREKMILENRSTNTGDNVIFTKKILEEKGIKLSKVILVQKPYMERRAYATFKKSFADIEPMVSSQKISFAEYIAQGDSSRELQINMMVGDTQKIRIYAERGYLVPQEMPEEVIAAYKELARRGYDKYVLPE